MVEAQPLFLLDSHVLIWVTERGRQLRTETRNAISDPTRVRISAASIWELEIKRASGKLQTLGNVIEFVRTVGFTELPVTFRHAEIAAALPLLHRDPFDRMLIAQAQAEGLTLVTDDPQIARYDVPTLPAR